MTRGRAGKYASSAALALAVLALMTASAAASSNNGPGTSAPVTVGVPFTGNWPGTVWAHGNSFNHWWRLPSTMHPGDQIQIAVDNRLSKSSLHFCLLPPVDEFGADGALESCRESPYVEGGQQSRLSMTYSGSTGLPYLVPWIYLGCCYDRGEAADPDEGGQYSITLEQIVTLVNAGLVVPATLPASFTLSAGLTYGDNTPAGDGIPASLQWRLVAPRGSDPEPFVNVLGATSAGGVATFTGTMPSVAQGRKVQMRVCVAQPGSTAVRCSAAARTTVAISPCSRAEASLAAHARQVRRLKGRLHGARGRLAKRRLRHRLKGAKAKRARAAHSVDANCA
jgi:hypothetical protein